MRESESERPEPGERALGLNSTVALQVRRMHMLSPDALSRSTGSAVIAHQ